MCQNLNLEPSKQKITNLKQLNRREPDFCVSTQLCHSSDHFKAKAEKQRSVGTRPVS